jgi:hypothetical protein
MIVSCNKCDYCARVDGGEADPRLKHFKGVYPCFKCGEGMLVDHPNLTIGPGRPEEFTVQQFHLAVAQFGTPEERLAPDTILELMNGSKMEVTQYSISKGTRPRLTIQSIALDSGAEVFFGPSPGGAVVYKVIRRTRS